MTIVEILDGSDRDIKDNISLLAKDYLEKTGKTVCRTCSSDVQLMILTLKNFYNMTQFKFKRHAAMYKNKKGDKVTISNANMTDEKAVAFLKTKPKRIELFSDFPSNWKAMIKGEAKVETDKELKKRLAIEAEEKAAKDKKPKVEAKPKAEPEATEKNGTDTGAGAGAETEEEKTSRLEVEKALLKDDLSKMKLEDLRKKYPDVKSTSIKDFVEKVLESIEG